MADMTREEARKLVVAMITADCNTCILETDDNSSCNECNCKKLLAIIEDVFDKLEAYENADLIERSEAIELVNNPPLVVPFSQVKELEKIPRFEPTKGSDE